MSEFTFGQPSKPKTWKEVWAGDSIGDKIGLSLAVVATVLTFVALFGIAGYLIYKS